MDEDFNYQSSWHDSCLHVCPALPAMDTFGYFQILPRVVSIEYFGQSMLIETDCQSEQDKEKFQRMFEQSYILAVGILEGACP